MKVFKFLVPDDRFYPLPSNPSMEYKGCLALAVANTVEEARVVLIREAKFDGDDVSWLEIARVSEIDLNISRRVAWVGPPARGNA